MHYWHFYRPEKDIPENTTFNYYVSNIYIWSEHCIGFLKGCFQSLQDLCIYINTEKNMQFAALWLTACIIAHSFAMDHEDGSRVVNNDFYLQGLSIMQAEKAAKLAEEEAWDAARVAGLDVDVEMVRDQEDRLKLIRGQAKTWGIKKGLIVAYTWRLNTCTDM